MQPAQPAQPPPTGPRLQPSTVEDLVQTDVVTAERDTPVATLVAAMEQKDVGSVVIVDDDWPIGIVTDRSIALSLVTEPNIVGRTADDLVTRGLVTGTTGMDVFDTLRRMERERVRRLPLLDEEGQLSGIVTLDDLLVLLCGELENAASVIKTQSPRL
ncbi:CBS domain-containing protein [Halorarius litoreus]|uniref:CBS domain-containing protein n=1 Tax=Halorarius litoreus TaxID=2962676 RepID=UPI0020CD4A07|nr:CBS domain-containing protein [Halorarius litoreus]